MMVFCSRCKIRWELGTRVRSDGRLWDNSNCPRCGSFAANEMRDLEPGYETVIDSRVISEEARC
jgi:hypothetical protein